MDGSDAVAARFLRAVVTGVEGVLPVYVSLEFMSTDFVNFYADELRVDVSIRPDVELKVFLKEGWMPENRLYNGMYRCRLALLFPMAANGYGPRAQYERVVNEVGLQKVAGEFAGLIVAAVEASKRERGPRLVVDNTVGSEA